MVDTTPSEGGVTLAELARSRFTPTTSYGGLWVDGQSYLSAITRGHLIRELASYRLPTRLTAALLEETMGQLALAIPAAKRAVPSVADSVVDAVSARINRLQNSAH